MWGKSYVVTPGGNHGSAELLPIEKPEQLAGQEIAVGYHSGSRFTTIQSLSRSSAEIRSSSSSAVRFGRVDMGIGRDLPAVSVWGLSFQVLEHLGFRKIVDASFMIALPVPGRRGSSRYPEIHERIEARADGSRSRTGEVWQFYLNEMPDRYKSMVDVRRFSPGERIVFLPYTEAMYAKTQAWVHERGLFEGRAPAVDYAACVAA